MYFNLCLPSGNVLPRAMDAAWVITGHWMLSHNLGTLALALWIMAHPLYLCRSFEESSRRYR